MGENKRRVSAMERTRVKRPVNKAAADDSSVSASPTRATRRAVQDVKKGRSSSRTSASKNDPDLTVDELYELERRKTNVNNADNAKPKKQKSPRVKKEKSLSAASSKTQKKVKNPSNDSSPRSDRTFHISKGISDRSHVRSLVFLSAVAAIVAIVLIVNASLPGGIIESTGNMFAAMGKSGSFPAKISSSTRDIKSVSSGVAVLDESEILLYNSSGGIVYERQHGFADASMAVSGSRVLVYDRGGTGIRVENASGTLYTLDTEGAIYTADISDSGCFAVASDSAGYTSQAEVFTKNAKKKYVWYSAEAQITALSLSSNGRYLAVGTISASAGEYLSEVIILDTKSAEPLVRRKYEGSLLVSLDYKSDTVVAVMNDKAISLKRNGSENAFDFDGQTLVACDNRTSSGTVMVFNRYSDSNSNRVVYLNKKFEEIFSLDANFPISNVAVGSSGVSFVSSFDILSFNRRAVQTGRITNDYEPIHIAVSGSKVFYTGVSVLDSVSSNKTE